MKKLTYFFLIFSVSIFYACSGNTSNSNKPIEQREQFEKPIKKSSLQEVARTIDLSIEVPDESEIIRTAVYDDMKGKFVGDIPEEFTIWVLARDRHN